MKTIIRISPRKYPINNEDRCKYTPTSAFLPVLKEIDYLSSRVVSITNLPWTTTMNDFEDSVVDTDGLEIVFEYVCAIDIISLVNDTADQIMINLHTPAFFLSV